MPIYVSEVKIVRDSTCGFSLYSNRNREKEIPIVSGTALIVCESKGEKVLSGAARERS